MKIFYLILLIITIIYGGLTVLTASMQIKDKKINFGASLSMILGGVLIISSSIFLSIFTTYRLLMLMGGLLLIHLAAINNGFKLHGKINPKHNVVRLMISIIIIVLFCLTFKLL